MGLTYDARIFKSELAVFQKICKTIGSPRALTASLLAQHGQWDDLLSLTVNPDHYDNPQSFADDLLVTTMLSKCPRLPLSVNKREVAVRKFYESETLCSETNKRLVSLEHNALVVSPDVHSLIFKVRRIIRRILGPLTHDKLAFCERNMRFGPGATTSLSGVVTQGTKFHKQRTLDGTKEMVSFATFCLPHQWRADGPDLRIRESSKLTTVPKNAKTDRVICIEPDLNIYVQLGIGALIRERLAAFGLDLSTQENNQRLASQAYYKGLATVDLSSASDTISSELVASLIPSRWYELLKYARVSSTTVDGTRVDLNKWSSMGNGYTFELETLIFYAVALATAEIDEWGDVIAYGDDIILPAKRLPSLRWALDLLGFRVNPEKTFGSGLFYESCGTDWFAGVNVRPFFLRTQHHDYETVHYIYANAIRHYAGRHYGGHGCDVRFLPAWLHCFTAIAPADRHLIPKGVGDTGFVTDFDRATPGLGSRRKFGFQGYDYSYRRIPSIDACVSEQGCLTAFLSGLISDFRKSRESLRGRHKRPIKAVGYSFEWPNLGPWL